jgi:hypothetical protein
VEILRAQFEVSYMAEHTPSSQSSQDDQPPVRQKHTVKRRVGGLISPTTLALIDALDRLGSMLPINLAQPNTQLYSLGEEIIRKEFEEARMVTLTELPDEYVHVTQRQLHDPASQSIVPHSPGSPSQRTDPARNTKSTYAFFGDMLNAGRPLRDVFDAWLVETKSTTATGEARRHAIQAFKKGMLRIGWRVNIKTGEACYIDASAKSR